jgi:hypothetical protein
MAADGVVVTRAVAGATDMGMVGAALMPEVDTGMASQAADTTAEVDSTVAERASMVEAASTAEAEATVVDTGNPLLERIQRAGSIELPALLFLQLVAGPGAVVGHFALSSDLGPRGSRWISLRSAITLSALCVKIFLPQSMLRTAAEIAEKIVTPAYRPLYLVPKFLLEWRVAEPLR